MFYLGRVCVSETYLPLHLAIGIEIIKINRQEFVMCKYSSILSVTTKRMPTKLPTRKVLETSAKPKIIFILLHIGLSRNTSNCTVLLGIFLGLFLYYAELLVF